LSGDPQEVSWLTGGGPEVDVHGGSATGSTAVQWWLKAEEEEGAPQGGGGVAPFYSRRTRLENGGASGSRGRSNQGRGRAATAVV
jgi:hypothetical protein